MKRLLSIGVALGLGALAFSAPGAAAQRPCAVVSVKAIGLNEKAVSYRATRKLHRQINHWAHVNKLTKVRVGAPHTSCTKGAAKQLGDADADAELAELADQWPDNRIPRQEAPDPAAQSGQPVVVVPADTASSGKDEWVGISIDVNVRKAPSPTADPLRIAQKGEKLRVIGRESKWVQVTDPATSETGWVYSRFTEPARSPGQ
jgi:uncharacterized protein YgiM (DUF1202 family)